MTKPFDATTRQLIELGPADWLEYLGFPVPDRGRVTVIDSNVSTLTAEADKVIRVDDAEPWLEHVEFQAGRDVRLDVRAHRYSTLLQFRHEIPVRTSLVLLRPAADGPELTGKLELQHPGGAVYDTFLYDVIRVWEQPVDAVLACGLTVLPLAPVSRVDEADVPGVLLAISKRLEQETTPAQARSFWSATKVLMGLRYEPLQVDAIVRGVSAMLFGIHGIEESSVYQAILREGEAKGKAEGKAEGLAEGKAEGKAEGRVEEARQLLLDMGRQKLGDPGVEVERRIAALNDPDRLHALCCRISHVTSWDELFTAAGGSSSA